MRFLSAVIVLGFAISLSQSSVGLAQDSDADLEALENAEAADSSAPSNPAGPETTEQDLAPPSDSSAEQELMSDIPQDNGAPTDTPPAPEQAQQPPSPEPAPEATSPSGPPAVVTGLDFDGNLNGGTVVIKTSAPVQYTSRKNENNQFVIELQNTTVPKKFQRPYITKEFSGPIASINAYQASGPFKVARIVVQMKEAIEPAVSQEGNMINVAGGGAASGPEETAQAQEPPAPEPEAEEPTVAESEEEPAEEPQVATKSSGTVEDFLLGNTRFYGRKISIEVKDADIRDVFRLISEESGLNIIVSEDVTGKVSMKLKKIPWDQALTVLLQSRQLGYVKQGAILRIAPLRTLRAESEAAREVLESQKQLRPIRVQIFPLSYAKAEDMETQAKEFLSTRGKVKADKRTNSLVVSDIDENLEKVKKLVTRLDTQTPQVLIESKIVEARESFERSIGVSWNFNGVPTKISTNSTTGAPINWQPSLAIAPGTAGQSAGGGLDFGLQVGSFDLIGDLQATLKLLENERLVKVISSPRIVTLDRQDASIEQTTQFPIFNSSNDASGKPQTTVTFQDVKLQLQVKPQITVGGGIIMDVQVVREFPDAVVESGSSKARAINKRKAQTQVLVENGDTVVIGGIYQSDVSESESGVPFLRKIPVLGWLFKSRNITREKNELVIFLTPRILNKDQAFVRGEEG